MANTFLTPDLIAREALATLYQNTVMAQLVHRDHEADFRGKQGDTITVRKPATFTADEYARGSGLTVQDGTETGVTVTLDTLLDVSFAVTAEDMTLELEDFSEQLLNPAMEAISQAIDAKLLTLRTDVTAEVGQATGREWDDPRSLNDAARVLNQASVPMAMRRAVVGPISHAEWADDALFVQADQSGSTQALTENLLGRKFGFDTYMTQGIAVPDPQGVGISTTEENVAFHRDAFALVTRTLALPQGIGPNQGSVVNYKGFGLRVIYDYDIDQKQDVVSIDLLMGVKTMDANRAVLIKGADGS